MTCDHDATRASFEAFISGTRLIGGQSDGDGGWLLLGTCTACDTTLAIPIAEPRGQVVHGEITEAKADAAARAVPGQDVIDEPPPIRNGFRNGFCVHCRAAFMSAQDSPTLGYCPICGHANEGEDHA